MKIIHKFNLIFCLIGLVGYAQRPAPAPAQSKPIFIQGGTIHTGTGDVLEDTNILIENGVIRGFGKEKPVNAEVIDAAGKHIYPGFILVNNTMGLVEIASNRATVDFREVNAFTPEVRTVIAFNTDSHIIPTVRTNGILLTQPVMKSGIISGTSSVMNLDAWNWQDGVVEMDNGLHLAWPNFTDPYAKYREKKDKGKFKERRTKNLTKVYQLFKRAKTYESGHIKDYQLEAIAPVFSNKKTLFIEVPDAKAGLEALAFIHDVGIPSAVFIGRHNLEPILDQIKEANIPLIIARVHSLPISADASPNAAYTFPKKVKDKGILYGLDYSGDMEYHGGRNLPFTAGTTVAYGVDKEAALQSITYNLAKILGIDDRYGSLEIGKSATLFISEGDALNPITNKVSAAFIDGRKIDLNNQQKTLYQRYKKKYTED